MSRKFTNKSHRFVVVYRSEAREIDGASEVWRGWVERVPDPRQREIVGQTDERLSFNALTDLPDRIEVLIDRADAIVAENMSRSRRHS